MPVIVDDQVQSCVFLDTPGHQVKPLIPVTMSLLVFRAIFSSINFFYLIVVLYLVALSHRHLLPCELGVHV